MASRDSAAHTLKVALGLCLVCAVVVSTASVSLRDAQQANRLRDKQANILRAAGLYVEGRPVREQFAAIEQRLVDLRDGSYVDSAAAGMDPASWDGLAAARSGDDRLSTPLAALGVDDIARLGRREHYATVYLARDADGRISRLVLPVRGYGLWSTLLGFVALDADGQTLAGIGFYEHKETPGLGGEVDNPAWRALWPGKRILDDDGQLAIAVMKGAAIPGHPHHIDGLAGATLTTRGVHNLVRFWLGRQGFGPYLDRLRQGELQ